MHMVGILMENYAKLFEPANMLRVIVMAICRMSFVPQLLLKRGYCIISRLIDLTGKHFRTRA